MIQNCITFTEKLRNEMRKRFIFDTKRKTFTGNVAVLCVMAAFAFFPLYFFFCHFLPGGTVQDIEIFPLKEARNTISLSKPIPLLVPYVILL